ncbi:MAG: FAD-dependent thymidylate synthase [Ruminococcaceae bacterium]|nr:FAD-dependent thymidylate synthase [Oscillospiraceae bacterium]
MMKVILLSHTDNPEKIVAAAAKLCYSEVGVGELMDNLEKEEAGKFVDMLLNELGHESPVEHANFTFAIEGVSRSFLAQITRHRIASYSVQSQRYVKLENFQFVIPPSIENDRNAKKLFLDSMRNEAESYLKLTKLLSEKYSEELISSGISEKKAGRLSEKMAIENARFVLPNACETKMIVTMNARSLLNFFRQRCCNRAQWEIREAAERMLKLVYNLAPSIFRNAGPPCLSGQCPEGKMSCGKMVEVRKHYEELKGN